MIMMDREVIHLYEGVPQRREHAFPTYFFTGTEGKQCAAIVAKYVVETEENGIAQIYVVK